MLRYFPQAEHLISDPTPNLRTQLLMGAQTQRKTIIEVLVLFELSIAHHRPFSGLLDGFVVPPMETGAYPQPFSGHGALKNVTISKRNTLTLHG